MENVKDNKEVESAVNQEQATTPKEPEQLSQKDLQKEMAKLQAEREAFIKEKEAYATAKDREIKEAKNIASFKQKYIENGGIEKYFNSVVRLKPEVKNNVINNSTLQKWMTDELDFAFDKAKTISRIDNKPGSPEGFNKARKEIYGNQQTTTINKEFVANHLKALGIKPDKEK